MVMRKVNSVFTPSALVGIVPLLRDDSKILGTAYEGISTLTVELLRLTGLDVEPPYEDFLKKRMRAALNRYKREIKALDAREFVNDKERWKLVQVNVTLALSVSAHKKLDDAWAALQAGDRVTFVDEIVGSGVSFGQMKMVYELYQSDVFPRIGSIFSAISGASIGGKKSGFTRRTQSRLPNAVALREERAELIRLGKPSRDVCAMLARRYSCTSDHIRKILKRD